MTILSERLRHMQTDKGQSLHQLIEQVCDENDRLHKALADCISRLRTCAENGGNAPFAVDALCKQFEDALNGAAA